MSEPENAPAAEETAEEGGAPKKSFKKLILIALVLIIGLGGGGGYYFFVHRAAAAEDGEESETEAKAEPKAEKKAKKKPTPEPEEEAEEEEAPPKKSGTLRSSLPKDEDVKKVIELPPFIVNLADTENSRYLRMTVSLGVGGEEGAAESEKPDQLFMTRVRNAMLAVIADKKSDEILTVEGKTKLRKELLRAAQAASEEPHVTAIYITDFIVQL